MNKRVWQTFIFLIWLFLISFAVIKIFFADWFVVQLNNETLKNIGIFISGHKWSLFIGYLATRYFTYNFYLCACQRFWRLPLKEHAILLLVSLFLVYINIWHPDYLLILDVFAMILLPFVFGADYKQFVTVFGLHYCGQLFLLFIRSEQLLLAGNDFATQVVICFDAYIWIILYYLYANLYREETIWEVLARRFSTMLNALNLSRNSKK